MRKNGVILSILFGVGLACAFADLEAMPRRASSAKSDSPKAKNKPASKKGKPNASCATAILASMLSTAPAASSESPIEEQDILEFSQRLHTLWDAALAGEDLSVKFDADTQTMIDNLGNKSVHLTAPQITAVQNYLRNIPRKDVANALRVSGIFKHAKDKTIAELLWKALKIGDDPIMKKLPAECQNDADCVAAAEIVGEFVRFISLQALYSPAVTFRGKNFQPRTLMLALPSHQLVVHFTISGECDSAYITFQDSASLQRDFLPEKRTTTRRGTTSQRRSPRTAAASQKSSTPTPQKSVVPAEIGGVHIDWAHLPPRLQSPDTWFQNLTDTERQQLIEGLTDALSGGKDLDHYPVDNEGREFIVIKAAGEEPNYLAIVPIAADRITVLFGGSFSNFENDFDTIKMILIGLSPR